MFGDLLQRVVKPRSRATVRRQRRHCLTFEPLESRRLLTYQIRTLYSVEDLVADATEVGGHTSKNTIVDSHLVNAWGVALSPASGIGVSSNSKGFSEIYALGEAGGGLQKSLEVSIPGGAPTGQVFNTTGDFRLPVGSPATFLFASASGAVTGWNRFTQEAQRTFQATDGAIYTGIALANNEGTANYLYLADFYNKKIDVLDSTFKKTTLAGNFTDPDTNFNRDYAPFNVAAIGGMIYVAYAKRDANGNVHPGKDFGVVDVFQTNGTFVKRLVDRDHLNAPWAMVQAPANFGDASTAASPDGPALLVGSFGDGRISAYNPRTGKYLGELSDTSASYALKINGLRGLAFGNGGVSGDPTTLYYAAGPVNGSHGLLGKITLKIRGTSAVTASLAGDTLTITGSPDRDNVRVTREGARQQIVVRADGRQIGTFDPAQVGSIHFHGWAGDDSIVISPSVKATAILDGGAGNDRLIAGGGHSILLGGLGNDFLHATFGRNVLIGGEGRDNFQGGMHDDLLIAGTTAHDADTAALLQILAEWTSTDSYNTRVSKLRNGTDGLPQLDATTVFDDDARDFLLGNGGLDWFFASTDDKLAGRSRNEQRN